ncbi:MAG TPA: alpha/beta hydrolase [Alphaproteobacteria bacterium]
MHNPVPLSGFSQELQKTMTAIGPVWGTNVPKHRDMVWALFDPLLAAAPKDGVTTTRDVSYGPHKRHLLDIYRPAAARPAPVVIFVHGGAFVRGSKDASPQGYGNVLSWFARQGYLGINLEYRLAPEAPYPAGADDIARAVAWVKNAARDQGGNPDRVFLIGHSAGGTHVATYGFDPAAKHLGSGVKGAVLISSRLRADVSPENPNAGPVKAYYGDDPSVYDARSPVTHVAASALPTMVAIAEFENPLLDIYGLEFAWRMSLVRRRAIPFIRMGRHNHISMVAHFNTTEEILGRAILEFFDSVA